MARVAREFTAKKEKLGARKAAEQLQVSLASFYNYVAGTDLPRAEVLKRAYVKWGIKWPMLDLSEMMRTQNVRSPEQLAFSFIDAVREGDVEIITVEQVGKSQLQVKLRIHFQPLRLRNATQKP
jgi:predicted DNA-binding transcriptional regulator AlpA